MANRATPSYSVDYNDERFQDVEADKDAAINELTETYDNIISESDSYYQAQIDAAQDWATTQQDLQNQQTDLLVEQVEQQKDQAEKDYTKEQSGAYVDWQKQSGQYGVNAEQMAAGGLTNTGFSESSQVSMYNTYQSRVATARESYNQAVLNYDNAIKEAMLQNNSKLAEIAYQALQTQLQLSLEGFQYKNQLVLDQVNKKQELDNTYYNRYQDVLNQINQENALAEQIRQYNQEYQLQLKQYNEQVRQFNVEMERLKKKDTEEAKRQAEQLALQKKQLEIEQSQWEKEYDLSLKKLQEEKRQFDKTYSLNASKISGGGGSDDPSNIIKNSGNAVNTAYYSGPLNHDANKYGTFSNGYQPKGISGHGKVSKTGETLELETETIYGQKQTVVQNVWKTNDGAKWYWDGRRNKYIQFSAGKQKGKGTK
jgi:hypothetical protein